MQAVRLADGTQVELNTNTRLHADVNGLSRTVMLDSGEAYFDVVHDAKRPFTVYAGNRRITDIGTKFSVFRDGDDVRVTVREGKVRVDVLHEPRRRRCGRGRPCGGDQGQAKPWSSQKPVKTSPMS